MAYMIDCWAGEWPFRGRGYLGVLKPMVAVDGL